MRALIVFILLLFAFVHSPLLAQNLFYLHNKWIGIDTLVKQYEVELALKQIDSLSNNINEDLTKLEKREYLLQLQLLKAKVYDDNYEMGKALPILLQVVEEALADDFNRITAYAYLLLASVKSKSNDLDENKRYVELAKTHIQQHGLDDLYGYYYYQKATCHRFTNEVDSVLAYALKGLEYGLKYNNEEDIALTNNMLGVAYGAKGEGEKSIYHYNQSIPYYQKVGNYTHLPMVYGNISREYFKADDVEKSFLYIDSAYIYYDKISYFYKERLPLHKFDLFYHVGNKDSAIHYLMDYHNASYANVALRETHKIKEVSEKYENEKKEAVIQSKNQQMVFIICLLLVIAGAAALLIRTNRQINSKNRIISKQVEELVKILEQKQVLLSELQHRVKNNLQHVISILEIQKESVDFNNIDELIRGNQNRIHSMALLHKKLSVSDNVNEVDLYRYVIELSALVKDSYDSHKKKIQLNVQCEIDTISIEKALPLGLIVVELVSNSMKHAFKNHSIGIISIEITKDEATNKSKLYYADNGSGFNFNSTAAKGLGLEIIKGLIDQLNGTVITRNEKGFELIVLF